MLPWLIVLFVTIPLAELALLVWVGGQVGLAATVALVIVTGILGASLARSQGLATLARFQRRLAAGELPHQDLVEGILILVAGAVLLTPGLITDVAGFLLLVPVVRGAVRRWLVARFSARMVLVTPGGTAASGPTGASQRGPGQTRSGRPRHTRPSDPDVVDAEFEVKE